MSSLLLKNERTIVTMFIVFFGSFNHMVVILWRSPSQLVLCDDSQESLETFTFEHILENAYPLRLSNLKCSHNPIWVSKTKETLHHWHLGVIQIKETQV